MEIVETCWEGCGEEVAFHIPGGRQDGQLSQGVKVKCPECGHGYVLTADGDGEAELQSLDESSLGEVITDPDSTHY